MEQKLGKPLFPGQEKGWIRILIKSGQQEDSVQLRFELFDDDPKSK